MSLSYQGTNPIARILSPTTNSSTLVYLLDTKAKITQQRRDFMSEPVDEEVAEEIYQALLEGSTLDEIVEMFQPPEEEEIGRYLKVRPTQIIAVLPSHDPERVMVCGMSGLGKSTVAANYAFEYSIMFPTNEIYLFC